MPLDEDNWKDYFGGLAEGAPLFVFDQTRITCFCSEVTNLLMWSHYADGLSGFCIEFDEAEIINEDEQTFLVQANYTDRPPLIDSLVYAVTEDQFEYALEHGYEEYEGELRRIELNEILRAAIASKPKEWQYEKEVRLIIKSSEENRNAILYKYPSHSIKSVILGEKSSIDFKARIKEVLAHLNLPIDVKVATRSKDAYQILIQNIEL